MNAYQMLRNRNRRHARRWHLGHSERPPFRGYVLYEDYGEPRLFKLWHKTSPAGRPMVILIRPTDTRAGRVIFLEGDLAGKLAESARLTVDGLDEVKA